MQVCKKLSDTYDKEAFKLRESVRIGLLNFTADEDKYKNAES